MKPKNLPGIERKLEHEGLSGDMAEKLTLSELNSFLLEVHRLKSLQTEASDLLTNYRQNRFVGPSDTDPFQLSGIKLEILKRATGLGFSAIDLSPLAPFGCCSVLAPVDQNNIVSALRGTEVLSDITNALALEAAVRRQEGHRDVVELCAAERMVRAQSFDNPRFSAHFMLYAMISASRDTGNYDFERKTLRKHLDFYLSYMEYQLKNPHLHISLTPITDSQGEIHRFNQITEGISKTYKGYPVQIENTRENYTYYSDLRMSIFVHARGEEHLLIDGGFTDWTQQLLNNRKERLFTSGIGLEYLLRIMEA